jgi:hypothetical protein
MPVLFRGTPRLRSAFVMSLPALAMLLSAAPARASAVPFVEFNPATVNVTPGGTGTFELDLVNPASFNLGGFNINIDVSSSSGVTFPVTGGNANTSATYILAGNSLGPIVTNPNGSNTIELNDLAATGSQTVGAGTYGLAVFSFSVAPGTPLGHITVTIDSATSFVDPTGAPIPVDITGTGTINVVSTVVPEPSTLVMAGLAATAGLGFWAKRRPASR